MSPEPPPDAELESLLGYVRASRGFDFSGYKRTSLTRRIRKRMADVQVDSFADYRDLLEADVDEFNALFNTILINVTSFFRDKAAWDFVAEEVIPKLIERMRPSEALRVWSAGCASGEEAYTIAMLLAEAMHVEELRDSVKIYATDIDQEALAQARVGSYTPKALADVPPALQERYFEALGDRHVVRPGLRRGVIFGRHDLTGDAPISRLDLLVCRNTLMYFNAEAQTHILNRFHFALDVEGYLFLGKAEMLLSHSSMFGPMNMKYRLFTKNDTGIPRERTAPTVPWQDTADRGVRRSLRELAMDAAPVAVVAVDVDGNLTFANSEARGVFGISVEDIGQPFRNFELSYRPTELRSRIEQAYSERRPVHLRGAERTFPDGATQAFDIVITPISAPDNAILGTSINFVDVTSVKRARDELQRAREDLETTYEELRSTNEELETTNEELQSSNEELETMNEELRSTNEELETANQELRERAIEVEDLNDRLGSLLASLPCAVIVLDGELLVELWNPVAEKLWGMSIDEAVGRSLAALDIGLPIGPLQAAFRACLDGRSNKELVTVDGVVRTGRRARFEVVVTPILGPAPPPGVVLVITEIEP
ncbi:MAG TPA: CheR family methyltransferase [Acidimicrobiales bacterium]|nr:CheR family methyltransferase [Acidimicrobiales bacterium]